MKGAAKKPSGAELRALREQRVQALNPAAEAQQREASFLSNLGRAQADFEWIVDNQAWTALGHDSLAAWWDAKVQPAMSALAMRPTREVATKVIAAIQEQEASLPRAQRRTKAQLAELVGTSEWVARGRQDRPQRRNAAVTDLEESTSETSPLAAEVTQAIQEIEQTAADRARDGTTADGIEASDTADDVPAAGDAVLKAASPAVTPEAEADVQVLMALGADPSGPIPASEWTDVSEYVADASALTTDSPTGRDHPSPDEIATPDWSENSHPHAGEAQNPHASGDSGAGATPPVIEERTGLPGDVLPELPASAYPPGSVPLDPAGEGPAAVLHAAGHPDPIARLLDVLEQINEVCKLDAWDIAQLGDDSCFDALVHAGDDFAEFVLSVQHARVELDRRS